MKLRLNLSEMIFRHVENNGNRLELSDHYQRVELPAKTVLPESTSRRPTLPEVGAVM